MTIDVPLGQLQRLLLGTCGFYWKAQAVVNGHKQAYRLVVIRVELRRLFVEFCRLCQVTSLERGARIEVVGLIEFGIEPDRRFEFFLRLIKVLLQRESQTARCMSFGQL